jgi:hypothetical protein
MEMTIVIAKYKESIDWSKNLNKPYIIFNKNPDDNHLFENNLPNMGRETDTFFNYIIGNYESLPDYVCFLQGDPFDHCPNALDLINNFSFNVPVLPLGSVYFRDGGDLDSTLKWAEFCKIEVKSSPKFISGMQCVVSKDLIKKRSKDSYENLHKNVCKELNVSAYTGYLFEYLWPTILGFNELI